MVSADATVDGADESEAHGSSGIWIVESGADGNIRACY